MHNYQSDWYLNLWTNNELDYVLIFQERYELIFQDSKKIMLVKTDLRREGGMKNKKNRMLEHMCSCITPGHA